MQLCLKVVCRVWDQSKVSGRFVAISLVFMDMVMVCLWIWLWYLGV